MNYEGGILLSLADKLAKKNEEQIKILTNHYEDTKIKLDQLLKDTKGVSDELINLQYQLNDLLEKQLSLINQGGNPFKQ